MLTFEYFLVCDSVILDAFTDAVSLLNVMEQLAVDAIPAVIPRMTMVGCWRIDPDDRPNDYQAKYRIIPPGPPPEGDPGYRDFRANLIVDRRRLRVIFTVIGVPIRNVGDLRVELFLNDSVQARATHLITIEVAPVAEPGEGFQQGVSQDSALRN
jgi:hypothetical protein